MRTRFVETAARTKRVDLSGQFAWQSADNAPRIISIVEVLMATRDLEQGFYLDYRTVAIPGTYLPPFPDESAILHAIPEIAAGQVRLDKPSFLAWVDFTLEHPDEIWEIDESNDSKTIQYLGFLELYGRWPVFAVEVFSFDEVMEVHDYSLVLNEREFMSIRSGKLVYSRTREWQRERQVRTLNDRALVKYDEDSLEEARELIDAAIRVSGSGAAYLLNNRGLICWKMGKTDEAKQDFLESMSLDRGNGDPYFNIGLIYFDESDYRRALHYLKIAVEIDPLDSQFLTELGHLYLELEREEDALKLFRKAFENDPEDPQVDFHLGHYFLYKKRDPRHAIRYYGKGLKKDPEDQFALADLAVAHWILGNRRKVIGIGRTLQRHGHLMPYTISRLVYLNVEMGNYEKALTYYKKALTHSEPFEPEWLHYNAAIIYAKTGQDKQALHILDLAVKAGGDAVVKRAMSDEALRQIKSTPDFKRLVKLSARRRNR